MPVVVVEEEEVEEVVAVDATDLGVFFILEAAVDMCACVYVRMSICVLHLRWIKWICS